MEHKHPAYEPGQPLEHVYFPVSGIISIVSVTRDHREVEIATVGNEGMVGLPLFLGSRSAPEKAYAQVPGESLRIRAKIFERELRASPVLVGILHLYTSAFLIQVSQGMVCNRIHSLPQRCARWLLMTCDRVGNDRFQLTQESLAVMLGVRRTGASEIAAKLKKSGLVRYSRGNIQIIDRRGLEALSCECYSKVKREFDRVFQLSVVAPSREDEQLHEVVANDLLVNVN